MIKPAVLAIAAAVAFPSIAAADHEDIARRTRLVEVSADPRDGVDVVDLSARERFTQLELRAREDRVRLRGIDIRFADGRVIHHPEREILQPGESHVIALPRHAGRIASLVIDYGDRDTRWSDRTDARLEVFGIVDVRADRDDDRRRYDGWPGRDDDDRHARRDRDQTRRRWYDRRDEQTNTGRPKTPRCPIAIGAAISSSCRPRPAR